VAPPASVLSVPYGCPNLNSQTITTENNDVFNFTCGDDLPGNDIAALIAYTLADCCTACSGYNIQHKETICVALLFDANMSFAAAHSDPPGGYNCLLKGGIATPAPVVNSDGLYVAGMLQSKG
jgi:hypothetical protein